MAHVAKEVIRCNWLLLLSRKIKSVSAEIISVAKMKRCVQNNIFFVIVIMVIIVTAVKYPSSVAIAAPRIE